MSDDGEEAGDSGPFGIEKAKYALCACCCGIILLPCMLIMLGSNEKNYVCRQKDIIYAEKSASEVACTGTPPNDKFVFFSCELDTSKLQTFTLKDFNPGFDAQLASTITFNSAAASQTVDMYQCIESSSTRTEGTDKNAQTVTTYSYSLDWRSARISATGYQNKTGAKAVCGPSFVDNPNFPNNVGGSSKKEMAGGVPVGMFKLHAKLSNTFQADTTVKLDKFASKFPASVSNVPPTSITKDKIKPIGDYLMTCNSATLGCVRISLKQNGAKDASVFANSGSNGNTAPQKTKSSWGCSSGTFAEIFKSRKSKAEAISSLESSNTSSLWALRIIGVLMSWAAVFCCMYPIIAAFDIVGDYLGEVPCVGCLLKMIADIVETLVKLVVCCMSCSFGCSCAFFVIAVVWVVMRPTVGIILLLIIVVFSVGACVLMKMAPKKGDKVKTAPEEDAENGS